MYYYYVANVMKFFELFRIFYTKGHFLVIEI